MTEQQLKYYLSSPRFNVYLAKTNNDFDKVYRLYKANIELSEAFYPILSVLEVSLRNAINETLKLHFNDPFWFKNTPKHLRQRDTIADALYRIRTLRNRIYHYEPIFVNLQDIQNHYIEMLTFLTWLDNDLPKLLTDIDRFNDILKKAKSI